LGTIEMIEAALPSLRRYASALVQDKREQDDLVYACLVRAMDRLHTLHAIPNLKIWLFSTLHNVFVREQRRSEARNDSMSFDPNVVDQFSICGDQDAWLVRATLRALYALPSDQRQVLALISVEDMSYAEVAQILGIPLRSVISCLSRGRERLRQAVEGQKTDRKG
jgi:RNA polymerase sigma-70 factor (ECF subfamily)